MGLMDLLKTSDPMEKFYAAAEKSNVPQGGVTGAAFKSMFPYGLGNKAFGREPEPMPDMASPQGTQVMAELVQNVVGPGTFIGPKGLARLFGDDAAKGMLATAESKLAQGVPRESVFKELGVFKGPEGKWRYEIDNSGMTGIPGGMGSGVKDSGGAYLAKVGDAINHDELFKSSPSLRYIDLEMNPAHQTRGSHMDGHIAVKGDVTTQRGWVANAKQLADEFAQKDFKDGDFGSLKEALDYHNAEFAADSKYGDLSKGDASTLLHELQHALQGREDFARGGSGSVNEWINPGYRKDLLKVAQEIMDEPPPSYELFWGKDRTPEGEAAYAKYLKQFNSKEAKAQRWAAAQQGAPIRAYSRLAGEAESRAVQDRMSMSMPERRASFPQYATRDDLIIRGLMSGGL